MDTNEETEILHMEETQIVDDIIESIVETQTPNPTPEPTQTIEEPTPEPTDVVQPTSGARLIIKPMGRVIQNNKSIGAKRISRNVSDLRRRKT